MKGHGSASDIMPTMSKKQAYGPSLSRRRFMQLAGASCLAAAGGLLGAGCAGAQAGAGVSGSSGSAAAAPSGSWSAGASSGSAGTADAAAGSELQERTLFAFDTVVTLRCTCPEELMNQAADRCNFFEERFSRTREGSDVWNVNHAAGEPVEVAPETADVISKALGYCERSGGLFDITIGAVTSLWDFQAGVKPADADVQEAVRHVDYRNVKVDGATVQLTDPAAMLDLGGIAKGYIADDLAALFRAGGCESGIINLGGNAYVIGSKPDGSPWNVGVQDPNGADQQVIAKLTCTDMSVVTSGLYEREFVQDGATYYHILDPKTGYPVETDLVSSSVASASSLDGDAYATWMFLLGHDAALALLEATDGLEGLVVDSQGAITTTKGAEFELL